MDRRERRRGDVVSEAGGEADGANESLNDRVEAVERASIEGALAKTYTAALNSVEQAGIARGLFPLDPVFSLDQLVDRSFWPGSIFGGRVFSF